MISRLSSSLLFLMFGTDSMPSGIVFYFILHQLFCILATFYTFIIDINVRHFTSSVISTSEYTISKLKHCSRTSKIACIGV